LVPIDFLYAISYRLSIVTFALGCTVYPQHIPYRQRQTTDGCKSITLTYLHLDPPVLDRTMGSKSSPSAPVCSHSPDAVPIDSSDRTK